MATVKVQNISGNVAQTCAVSTGPFFAAQQPGMEARKMPQPGMEARKMPVARKMPKIQKKS